MGKRGKGVMFRVPLIATELGGFKIVPDPHGPNAQHWNASNNTFTFRKRNFSQMQTIDHHYVEFTIVEDQTKKGVRFPQDPENAMWVINEARCPVPTDTCEYDVMKPLAVIGGDTLLAVNFNETDGQKIGFRLNFVETNTADDTDPGNYKPWDPIVHNKNGGV